MRTKTEKWLQLEDFSFGGFNCQVGGQRRVSAAGWDWEGTVAQEEPASPTAVGAKCCLTFHHLHVMIYTQKLRVSARHRAMSRPYLMLYQLPATLVSCELNLTRRSADVSTVTPSSFTSLDLSVCGPSRIYCSARRPESVVPSHDRATKLRFTTVHIFVKSDLFRW